MDDQQVVNRKFVRCGLDLVETALQRILEPVIEAHYHPSPVPDRFYEQSRSSLELGAMLRFMIQDRHAKTPLFKNLKIYSYAHQILFCRNDAMQSGQIDNDEAQLYLCQMAMFLKLLEQYSTRSRVIELFRELNDVIESRAERITSEIGQGSQTSRNYREESTGLGVEWKNLQKQSDLAEHAFFDLIDDDPDTEDEDFEDLTDFPEGAFQYFVDQMGEGYLRSTGTYDFFKEIMGNGYKSSEARLRILKDYLEN